MYYKSSGEFVRLTEYKPYKFRWWNSRPALFAYLLMTPFISLGLGYLLSKII